MQWNSVRGFNFDEDIFKFYEKNRKQDFPIFNPTFPNSFVQRLKQGKHILVFFVMRIIIFH